MGFRDTPEACHGVGAMTALEAPAAPAAAERRPALLRLLRGRPQDPAWVRPSLLALLAAVGVLYLWGLSASGWANAYYSAAVQAGSVSWKAFFFGSFDAASAITVDKTPAALWLMGLSVRVFGLNSWSILVPQALAGVATVFVTYAAVRRVSRPTAGLLAAAVTALTPVAVLMFRYNNPDALLVLLLAAAAYAMVRAQERAETRWLVLAGGLVGFGFLAKMLQAFLVVPAFALAYLVAAPTPVRRRLWQALVAVGAMMAAGGWWVAVVELWPAATRPYIGGSQTNSMLELMLGYNGLGRLNGNETGSVVAGGGQGAAGMWGETGWSRMFGADVGTQVSWLLPAALLMLLAGLWWSRRAPRTDGLRSSYLLWGAWLVVTGLVFSYMAGIFHAYYTVALAPAVGALVGLGAVQAWELRRSHRSARLVPAAAVAAVTGWSWVLLDRTPDWLPWLAPLLLACGLMGAAGLLAVHRLPRALTAAAVVAALVATTGGSAAYSLDTAIEPHTGAIPSAGPLTLGGPGEGGAPAGMRGVLVPPTGATPGAGAPAGGALGLIRPRPGATPPGDGRSDGGIPLGPGAALGGLGGLLEASEPGEDLVALLTTDAAAYTWVAATIGANAGAGLQLATERPVLAIGGFNGTDPYPSLAAFQALVAEGEVHYFVSGGRGGPGGSSASSEEIGAWVTSTFEPTTVDGVTVYDLTAPIGG
jgi:4-amino-4-deoxy-L-arabinose transferase-like glycosyltransferase